MDCQACHDVHDSKEKNAEKSMRIPHLTHVPVLAGVLGFGVTSLFARTPNKKPAARGDDLCSRHRSSGRAIVADDGRLFRRVRTQDSTFITVNSTLGTKTYTKQSAILRQPPLDRRGAAIRGFETACPFKEWRS
jgi:hypothetical protein